MLKKIKKMNDTVTSNILAFPTEKQPARAASSVADPLAPTIFHESWWLNIVTGGNYKVAEVKENGEVVGRLPYFLKNRFGIKYSLLPPMTHFLGPAILEGDGSPETRFLRRAKITRDLIAQLPRASIYRYKCHHHIKDTIAFQQERFLTNVQFTHEVLPDSEENMWKNMRSKKRKKIRAAQKQLTLGEIQDPLEFWQFYHRNLRQRKMKNVCDQRICCNLIEACLRRECGRIYAAWDKNNKLVAAVFCVWDNTTSFYFMSSRTPDSPQGAVSLLAWEAMKEAGTRGLIFDFDGLNNSEGLLFFTEFGGAVSPRYIVTRTTLAGRIALGIKNGFQESRYFY